MHFVSEFRVGNESVFIFVQFVGQLAHVLLSNEESSGLEKSSQLVSGDGTRVVDVAAIESFVQVEAWASLKSLS